MKIYFEKMFQKNVCGADRAIRVITGMTLLVLFCTNVITGTLGIILIIVGADLLVTGILQFCLINWLFGINTCKK